MFGFEFMYLCRIKFTQTKARELLHSLAFSSRSVCHSDLYLYDSGLTAPFAAFGSIYLIWNEIAEHIDLNCKPVNDNTRLSELKAMISYIHEYYSQKITLEDIAQTGYVSKRTCGGLFLKYLYKTPIEYLNDYRLQKSIELMKSTDKTILDIGLACGFSGASYFAEVFRRSFGKSPAEYRKNSYNMAKSCKSAGVSI